MVPLMCPTSIMSYGEKCGGFSIRLLFEIQTEGAERVPVLGKPLRTPWSLAVGCIKVTETEGKAHLPIPTIDTRDAPHAIKKGIGLFVRKSSGRKKHDLICFLNLCDGITTKENILCFRIHS